MFVGKVVGTVWSTVKWPGMTGHKLLLVRPYHLADLLLHPQAHQPPKPKPRNWRSGSGCFSATEVTGTASATCRDPERGRGLHRSAGRRRGR
jgi:hypothetical protein